MAQKISEKQATNNLLLRLRGDNMTMFRNNNGIGLTLDGREKIKFGLGRGTSDYIGYTKITVTPEMVGQQIAVFTAVEVKGSDTPYSEGQREFLELINKIGGIAKTFRGDKYE